MIQKLKYKTKFPDIKNLQSTAYVENQIRRVQVWQKKHHIPNPIISQLNSNSSSIQYNPKKNQISQVNNNKFTLSDEQLLKAQQTLHNIQQLFHKIQSINYRFLCTNLEECSKKYEIQFEVIQKLIQQTKKELYLRLESCQAQLQTLRSNHIKRMEDKQKIYNRKEMGQKSLEILHHQNELKKIKKRVKNVELSNKKFYLFNLRFGLNTKNQGLIWIFDYLQTTPSEDQFPSFLIESEKLYLMKIYLIQKRKKKLIEEKQQLKTELSQSHTNKNMEIMRTQGFNTINEKKIKSTRLQNKIDKKMEVVDFQKEKMKPIIINSTRINTTTYEIIYEQTKKQLKLICSTSNLKDITLNSNRNYKKTIKTEFQGKFLNNQNQMKQLIIEEKKLTILVKNKIKNQFDSFPSKFTFNQERIPCKVLAALFGWENAIKQIENNNKLKEYMFEYFCQYPQKNNLK